MKTKVGIFVILIITILLYSSIIVSAKTNSTETYVVAFVKANTNKIAVRYSEDEGATWTDGSFPSMSAMRGVGYMTDKYGVVNFALMDNLNSVKFEWGIGPTAWGHEATTTSSFTLLSSVNGVPIDDGLQVVTFLTSGNGQKVSVYVWDYTSQQFIHGDQAPISYNSNVLGRPAISFFNDKIVLAWQRSTSIGTQIVTVSGTVDSAHDITWNSPRVLSGPSNIAYYIGNPALANDRNKYYLAIDFKASSTDCSGQDTCLSGWGVAVFESTDGNNWNIHSELDMDAVQNACVAIAAHESGTILVSAINTCLTSHTSEGVVIKKYTPNAGWSTLSSSTVFGASSIYPKDFSLINYGYPPQIIVTTTTDSNGNVITTTITKTSPDWTVFSIFTAFAVLFIKKKILK